MIWFGIHFYTCKIWFYTCNCWFYTCKFIILGFLLINVTCNLFFQYWQAETIHNQLWLVSENHFYTCKIWFYTCKIWFYTCKIWFYTWRSSKLCKNGYKFNLIYKTAEYLILHRFSNICGHFCTVLRTTRCKI